jgi:hypothetical protein
MHSDRDEKIYSYYPSEDMSHAHLHNGLPYPSLQAQILPPAALKMRMMLIMWQVNSHNPACGHCPLNPEGI